MENVKELELAEFAAIEEALKAVSSHAAPTRETSHATWQDGPAMKDRVKMLRHQSDTTQPYIALERALTETAAVDSALLVYPSRCHQRDDPVGRLHPGPARPASEPVLSGRRCRWPS